MKPAITLIELLVVIALVGIIAGVGWPSLDGWNCRQNLRNDFEQFNLFMSRVQSEGASRNVTTLVNVNISNGEASLRAYTLQNNICSLSNSQSLEPQIPRLTLPKNTKVSGPGMQYQCFYPDGSADANTYQFNRTCSDKEYLYKNQFFGATGLIEKLKWNYTSKSWNDL